MRHARIAFIFTFLTLAFNHTGTVRNEYDLVGVLALQLVRVTTGSPSYGTTGRLSWSTQGDVVSGPVSHNFLSPWRRQ